MVRYKMKYWFEWGGTCLWAANEAAIEQYDYAVDETKLPISGKLARYLSFLQSYYQTMMDWDEAPRRSPWWSDEDSADFYRRAEFAYHQLCKELGEAYEIEFSMQMTAFL